MITVRTLSPELAKKAETELSESEARIHVGLKRLKEWFSLQSDMKVQLELAKKVAQELNESEVRVTLGLKRLKEWLSLQPHIKSQLDDQWLVAFLRGCKFSLERATEKLDKFYTARTLCPEFFKNRDPTVGPVKDLIEKGLFLPLDNQVDPTGPIFLYMRATYNASEYSIYDYFKYFCMVYDILIYEYDQINISGMVTIFDLSAATLAHVRSVTFTANQKTVTTYSKAYPAPNAGIHCLNAPIGFDAIVWLAKIFMPASDADKIFIHTSMESLYRHVPKENLPREFGGRAGSFTELTEKWKSIIEKHKDFLIEGEKYCTDENLRPGGPVTNNPDSACSIM